MPKKPVDSRSICRNRNIAMRYEVLDQFECGLALLGSEVKSLRENRGSLDEAFARFRDGELWLFGFHVAPYAHAGGRGHDPIRPRKLLLHRDELRHLRPRLDQQGLTLVPVEAYFNARGLIKIRLALARGKKLHDKRQILRARDDRREMDRAMRGRR